MVQNSLRTATHELQPELLNINSACETQSEKLDHFQEMQIIRQDDAKQDIREQIGKVNATIELSVLEILGSIGEHLSAVKTMSTQQSKSIEGFFSQLQQSIAVTTSQNGVGDRMLINDIRVEPTSSPDSAVSFDEDEQTLKNTSRTTHVKMLESICRMSRLASEKPRTSISREA